MMNETYDIRKDIVRSEEYGGEDDRLTLDLIIEGKQPHGSLLHKIAIMGWEAVGVGLSPYI